MPYFDHNATTPLRPEALEIMLPWLGPAANPSSIHWAGQQARAALDGARETLAEALGCSDREIIFTSGGTEANHLALNGTLGPGTRLVNTAVEHPSVLETARGLGARGCELVTLPVDARGELDWAQAEREITAETTLVSVMWVNNETGVRFDIERMSALCRDRGALLHVDGVQALGKVEIDLARVPVDFLTIAAHKVGGPVGMGALFVRRGRRIAAQLVGGKQEGGKRAGTTPVALAVGFAEAARLAMAERTEFMTRATALHERLQARTAGIEGLRTTVTDTSRVPTTWHACLRGLEGEALVMALDLEGFQVSSGSACASGSMEPSHVLRAMAVGPEWIRGALRVSFGRETTVDEVDAFADALTRTVARLRAGSRVQPAF